MKVVIGRVSLRVLLLLVVLAGVGAAAAQTVPAPNPSAPPGEPVERESPVPGQTGTETGAGGTGGILERDRLLGSMGGVRTRLEEYGIALGLSETSEVLGNVSGGRNRSVVYEGQTLASLDVDLSKAIGLGGGTVRVSALQIHGRGLSANSIDNINVVSSIEADRTTALYELWYQQSFSGGMVDVRLGKQSADLEFATSAYADLFVNSAFGWPTLFAEDLPGGGPAEPVAALGARLRVRPAGPLTLLLGVYNGSPSPPGSSGTSFRLNDGVFVIGEVQYAINSGEKATGLPGTYKLGAWYNSNAFANQFFTRSDGTAASLGAIPPHAARGNWSIYVAADQLVWRKPGLKEGGIGVFARATGAPGDRNEVNVFVDAGATYRGVFGRENDTVGIGIAWARISDTARAGDAATAALDLDFTPVRSSEVVLELTYQAQIAPWLQVQPLFQYVFNPRGGIANPDRPDKRLGDAAIFGLRTNVTF